MLYIYFSVENSFYLDWKKGLEKGGGKYINELSLDIYQENP
jgi:hypothetical protein